jgi:hypothetical protein
VFIGLVLMMVSAAAAAQAGDDYLKQLDSEASELNLDRETRRQAEESGDMRNAAGLAEVPAEEAHVLLPGLSREGFERSLKRNYMGSYTFFRRLSPQRQGEIYDAYRQDPDPRKLRLKIMKALKKQ